MQTPKPSRRALLGGAAAVAGGLAIDATVAAPALAATGLASLLPTDGIAHLLRRATFGATPASLAEAAALGLTGWLDRQLNPAAIDDSACDWMLTRLPLAGADVPTVRARSAVNSYESFAQLGRATIARAIWSNRQLFEMTVGFWANHLHIAAPSGPVWDSRADYDRNVTRKYAFGTFAEMLKASARHPAMLTFLDNRTSTKAHPNENYARELMELHTVGMIYTEADVQAAAKLLTGLTVDKAGQYAFSAPLHAIGSVNVLGFSHSNTTADGGEAAAVALLDYLARHPATAQRLAVKLCRRFVADDAPATLVAKLTKVYLDGDTAIIPVLRALFTSPEFAASIGQKVRTPFEDQAATVRALGLGPDAGSGVKGLDALYNNLVNTGNAPMRWPQPDGFPDVAAAWASPSAFLMRCNTHLNLAAGWYPQQLIRPTDLLKALVPVLPATYGGLLDALAKRLIGVALPAPQTAAVLLVARKTPASPLTAKDTTVAGTFPYLVALVLDSPSFQLR